MPLCEQPPDLEDSFTDGVCICIMKFLSAFKTIVIRSQLIAMDFMRLIKNVSVLWEGYTSMGLAIPNVEMSAYCSPSFVKELIQGDCVLCKGEWGCPISPAQPWLEIICSVYKIGEHLSCTKTCPALQSCHTSQGILS